jgi:transposase
VEVHLVHPLGVKGFRYRRVKNDELDAGDLADLLRMGSCRRRGIVPPEVRELRQVTRYRCELVSIRASCKAQVHGVLAKLGAAAARNAIAMAGGDLGGGGARCWPSAGPAAG